MPQCVIESLLSVLRKDFSSLSAAYIISCFVEDLASRQNLVSLMSGFMACKINSVSVLLLTNVSLDSPIRSNLSIRILHLAWWCLLQVIIQRRRHSDFVMYPW